MSRTNLDSVNNYVDEIGKSYWSIELGTYNLSDATRLLSFGDAISQPGQFLLELIVDPGEINGGDELKVQNREGEDAFYGVAQRPDRSSQGNDSVDGGGAALLLQDIPISGEFLNTTTDSLIQTVFDQLSTTKIVYNSGASEELSDGTGNVDIRAEDEGALNLLNRIVLSHGGEWYVSYNSGADQYEFIVQNEIRNTTSKTFTRENTREIRDAQVVDEEYDGVVVNGYGDGEDQIVAAYPARNNWPDDPKILKYTDKTLLSQTEADNVAENLYNDHTDWRNITVYPANENELLQLGDEVTIDEPRTGLNGNYRVVERNLNIDLEGNTSIEYVFSDRPIGMLDQDEDIKEQTKSQTDYSQGNRNTLNESNDDIAGPDQGLEIEYNVPEKFVRDIKGEDRVAEITLDLKAKDYKQIIPSPEDPTSVINEDKVDGGVLKDVDDFGNVDDVRTNPLEFDPEEERRTGGRFLSQDTDKEIIGNNGEAHIRRYPRFIEEIGVESRTLTGGDQVFDITFNTDFSTTPVINADVNIDDYFGTDVNTHIINAEDNGFGFKVESSGAEDEAVDIHYHAKQEIFDSSISFSGTLPNSLIDEITSEDRGEIQGVTATMFFVNGSDEELTITFDFDVSGASSATATADISPGISANFPIFISGSDIGGASYEATWTRSFGTPNIRNSPGTSVDTTVGVIVDEVSDQQHEVEEDEEGTDKIAAYIENTDGTPVESGVDAETSRENDIADSTTIGINELEEDEPILIKKETQATEVEIFVNNESIGIYDIDNEEIDVTPQSNIPGKNTIEIVPNSKAEVHGNVIIDHKVEGERT